jgi:hypothetical protein
LSSTDGFAGFGSNKDVVVVREGEEEGEESEGKEEVQHAGGDTGSEGGVLEDSKGIKYKGHPMPTRCLRVRRYCETVTRIEGSAVEMLHLQACREAGMEKLGPADFAELESPGVVDTIELEGCGGNGERQEDLWRWVVLFYWVDNLDGQVDRYQVNGSEV